MIFIESWKGWEGMNILLKADKDSTTQRWKKHWWLLVTIIIMITIININNIIIWLRFVRVCVHVYIWLKMCVGREQHTECMIMPLINMYYIYIYIYIFESCFYHFEPKCRKFVNRNDPNRFPCFLIAIQLLSIHIKYKLYIFLLLILHLVVCVAIHLFRSAFFMACSADDGGYE